LPANTPADRPSTIKNPDYLKRKRAEAKAIEDRAAALAGPVEVTQAPSFTCPRCGRTSHNPNDAREGYCGHCHDWTGRQ